MALVTSNLLAEPNVSKGENQMEHSSYNEATTEKGTQNATNESIEENKSPETKEREIDTKSQTQQTN